MPATFKDNKEPNASGEGQSIRRESWKVMGRGEISGFNSEEEGIPLEDLEHYQLF
jgi:hypothetical protein